MTIDHLTGEERDVDLTGVEPDPLPAKRLTEEELEELDRRAIAAVLVEISDVDARRLTAELRAVRKENEGLHEKFMRICKTYHENAAILDGLPARVVDVEVLKTILRNLPLNEAGRAISQVAIDYLADHTIDTRPGAQAAERGEGVSLSHLLLDLAKHGCFPSIYRRGDLWRAHVNRVGNFWADARTAYAATKAAKDLWEAAGCPMDGMGYDNRKEPPCPK